MAQREAGVVGAAKAHPCCSDPCSSWESTSAARVTAWHQAPGLVEDLPTNLLTNRVPQNLPGAGAIPTGRRCHLEHLMQGMVEAFTFGKLGKHRGGEALQKEKTPSGKQWELPAHQN